jgi:hypothetical protein
MTLSYEILLLEQIQAFVKSNTIDRPNILNSNKLSIVLHIAMKRYAIKMKDKRAK